MSDSLRTLCVCSCLTCRFCICVSECVHVWAASSPLDWSPTVLSISTPEPIRLHSQKKKRSPKATYSNVINSYAKVMRSLSGFTYRDKKKKKKRLTGGSPRPKVSSYGLRSSRQRLEKVIFQHFSANNSRLRNKLPHVLMLNSPSPPTREIK